MECEGGMVDRCVSGVVGLAGGAADAGSRRGDTTTTMCFLENCGLEYVDRLDIFSRWPSPGRGLTNLREEAT